MVIEMVAHTTPSRLRRLADDMERAWAALRVGGTVPRLLLDHNATGAVYVSPDQTLMYRESTIKGEK